MKYAYKDEEKTLLVQAEEAEEQRIYYCQNLECPAQVHVCALDSTKISPYFSSYKKFPHSANCIYKSSYMNIKKYQTKNFNLNLFFEKLTSSTIDSSQESTGDKTLHSDTAKQNTLSLPYSLMKLYKYLLNSSLEDILCERKVSDILADLRSEHILSLIHI